MFDIATDGQLVDVPGAGRARFLLGGSRMRTSSGCFGSEEWTGTLSCPSWPRRYMEADGVQLSEHSREDGYG